MTLDEAIKHSEEVAEEKEKLCRFSDDFNFSQPKWRKCAEEHRQLAEWLKELKQLREQTRWIPVSERLPEEKLAVLVWCPEYKNMYCAYLENKNWWIFGAFSQVIPNAVIAWMPLPEPYKAESEELK